jgi:hypothetical protein
VSETTAPTSPTTGGTSSNGATDATKSAAAKLTAHPKVQQAISYAKSHPLGAVATVAAAAALIEIEFAVGILTGLGATAFLANKSGSQAREEVIARGKQAIARARTLIAKRKKSATAPSSAASESAAPPPA